MRRTLLVGLVCVSLLGGTAAAATAAPIYVVKGHGWGHGIGLSQYGAQGFAGSGWGYRRILGHYYRGTELGPGQTERVRVLLGAGRKKMVIGSKKPFRVVDARGRKATLPAGQVGLGPKLVVKIRGKGVELASPLRFHPGAAPLTLNGAGYRGQLVVRSRGGSMSVVNEVRLELYLRGVVPWEMPSHWHPEALKAQAVVARSYALATRKPGKIYDMHADVRSQVYGGIRAEKEATSRAIGATAGQVLRHDGGVATTFYHSTSGGKTAAVRDVWPNAEAVPYLRSVADPWSRISPHHVWEPVVLTPAQLGKRLKLGGPARDVHVRGTASGRVSELVLRTPKGARTVPAGDVRRALELKSTFFRIGVLDLQQPQGAAVFGTPLALTGTARGMEGVVVQRRDGATWRAVAKVRPGKDGRFALKVQPVQGAAYRLAAERRAGPAVQVPVAAAVEVKAARTALQGRVRPVQRGRRVAIQRQTAGAWHTITVTIADGEGLFRAEAELQPGRYRAHVAAAGGLLAGASEPLELRQGLGR